MVITLSVDVVVHVGVSDGRAEKVVRVNRKPDFLTDGSKLLWRLNGDFELGFLVFLNLEIAAGADFANGRGDVVAAERRFVTHV